MPFCKEDFTDDAVIAELPCGHSFWHSECVEQWLKQSNSCPNCRMKLPSKESEDEAARVNGIVADAVGVDNHSVNNGINGSNAQAGVVGTYNILDEANDSGVERAENASTQIVETDDDDDVVMSDNEAGISW